MNIILAADSNYLKPARVMLKSLAENNGGPLNVYLLHSALSLAEREEFQAACQLFSDRLRVNFVFVDGAMFKDLPLTFGMPRTIYYRFAALNLLPEAVTRALYLDCDTLVIRSIAEFYHTDFENNLFVACEDIGISVTGKYKFLSIFGRLDKELHKGKYFNSGVLLINMTLAKKLIILDEVFAAVSRYRGDLTFNDQDLLNFLYGDRTKYADYRIYNMGAGYVTGDGQDTRLSSAGAPLCPGEEWVRENTAIIHYYGAPDAKPWLPAKGEVSAMTRLWREYAAGVLQENNMQA